jgi:hypothetical protein
LETSVANHRTIRLLEYDPDLGLSLRPERRHEAGRCALATMVELPRGNWDARALAQDCPYGMLVLDGLLAREVVLGATSSMQLIGRGDLIEPTGGSDADGLVAADVRWQVLEPASLALLDDRFLLVVRRWPELVAALFQRVAMQSTRLATHRALSQLPRVEDRLHALMWLLAERWGRVTPQGVILPLRLTHDMLGRLVGAKRPTVSIAVKALEERGTLHRRADGAWLLDERWVGANPASAAHPASTVFVADEAGNAEPGAWWDLDGFSRERIRYGVAPPTPSPVTDAIALHGRAGRLRREHERTRLDVAATLARAAAACERSAELRRRRQPSGLGQG